MTAPVWAPTVAQIAGYVPHRTLVRADQSTVESDDTYQFTFDLTTIPTSDLVQQLIEDGCAWVAARVSPLHSSMEGLARACTAILVGAWIERSWPNDEDSLQRANDMETRVDRMMSDLIEANNAANQTGDYGLDISPVWTFPMADSRWDCATYF